MSRRLLFFTIIVVVFSVGVIVWFFFYSQPAKTPSLGETSNPLSLRDFPKRFQFLNKGSDESGPSIQTTEITKITPQAFTNIWKSPAAGQSFVTEDLLAEISSTSTQGTTTILSKRFVHATGTILMFVDRITGHIYGYKRDTNVIYQISNTTIPGVYDAYIFDNGKYIVLRYADTTKNTIVGVLATIPSVKSDGQAEPLEDMAYLPSQVTSVAVNKADTELAYLVSNDTGSSVYTVSPQRKTTLVASSPLKSWLLSYGGNSLYATSKPSAYVEGETVSLPSFEFVVGQKTGLMSNPGEKGIILNSMWSSQGLKTFISNSEQIAVLPIATLASKCTWGKGATIFCAVPNIIQRGTEGLPDDWLQGRISFSDDLVLVDPTTNTTNVLYSPKTDKGLPFDVVGISLSDDDSLISFVRKQDGTLWLLDTSLLGGD